MERRCSYEGIQGKWSESTIMFTPECGWPLAVQNIQTKKQTLLKDENSLHCDYKP